MKKSSIYLYVPVIISRETKQSVADKKEGDFYDPPIVILGQGGFADYLVFVGIQFRL
jgi:hypothetical protein